MPAGSTESSVLLQSPGPSSASEAGSRPASSAEALPIVSGEVREVYAPPLLNEVGGGTKAATKSAPRGDETGCGFEAGGRRPIAVRRRPAQVGATPQRGGSTVEGAALPHLRRRRTGRDVALPDLRPRSGDRDARLAGRRSRSPGTPQTVAAAASRSSAPSACWGA